MRFLALVPLSILQVSLSLDARAVENLPMNPASYCQNSSIKKVTVPVFPGKHESPVFPFSYRKFAAQNAPNATTVIVLPGGPGDTLLEHTPTETNYPYGAVSTNQFNVIYTEPRGLGCNQVAAGDFADDAFRTEFLAHDVLAVIEAEKLQNYIIYGASFGTVEATYVAHLSKLKNLPAPKAVVLEGTLGRGVPGRFDEYISGFSQEWQRVKKIIAPQLATLFDQTSLPLRYAEDVWGAFIFKQLIAGDVPKYGPWLQIQLAPLVTGDAPGLAALKSSLDLYETVSRYPPLVRIPKIFQVLGCNELFGSWKPDILIKAGQLIGSGDDICHEANYLPYDSAILPMTSPIVYFQGPFDPATPLSSALYHFQNQRATYRSFVTVDGASHAPLSNSLRTLGCSDQVWKQIDRDVQKLDQSFSTCQGWRINLQRRAAGE